jgi:hypothetical protein
MRVALIKNVGQKVVALSQWDGVSHFNVPKNHTLIATDDPTVVEGVAVNIKDLQAQAVKDADARKSADAAAIAAGKARRVAEARKIVADADKSAPPANQASPQQSVT